MAWRGARVKGPEEEKLLLSSPLQLQNSLRPRRWPTSAGEGTNSLKVKFFFLSFCFCDFSSSGGERSGVQPHGASHPAAPQAGAGHRPGGGQHLRVLQRSLSAPAAAAAPFFSC